MIIHCTKKLFSKLPEQLTQSTSQSITSIGLLDAWQHWHANVINIQRKQCVILVHDATRYAVFLPAMNKKELADLFGHFQDVFINSLMKAGVDMELVEKAATYLYDNRLQLDTTCNRSVQGTMRLMAEEMDWSLKFDGKHIDDIAIYSTSAWLSDRPCNVKGQKDCIWPIKEMTKLLVQLPTIAPNMSVAEQANSATTDLKH